MTSQSTRQATRRTTATMSIAMLLVAVGQSATAIDNWMAHAWSRDFEDQTVGHQ